MTNAIQYSLHSGTMPTGVTLNSDGTFTGQAAPSNVGLGPMFTTPTSDGTVIATPNEGDAVNVSNFVLATGNAPVTYGIVSGGTGLPWGLSFDPVALTITGTVAPLKALQKPAVLSTTPPIWTTPFGALAASSELAVYTPITLAATASDGSTPITNFAVSSGWLPWGLVLSPTGVLSGTCVELKNYEAPTPFSYPPVPVWNTVGGTIAVNGEGDTVSVQLSCTPDPSRTITSWQVISGYTPWGLSLNFTSGLISGVIAEDKLTESVYVTTGFDPAFSDTVVVNGSSQTITGGGTIGTYTATATPVVTAQFAYTIATGRTFQNFYLASGSLPKGLYVTKMGQITGTISNKAVVGPYAFTLAVVDNMFVTTTRNYTLTVQ